jgi:hypothetical protein
LILAKEGKTRARELFRLAHKSRGHLQEPIAKGLVAVIGEDGTQICGGVIQILLPIVPVFTEEKSNAYAR